jgi:hypothetical protein
MPVAPDAPEVESPVKYPYRRRPRYVCGVLVPHGVDLRSRWGNRFGRLVRAYVKELGRPLTEFECGEVGLLVGLQIEEEQMRERSLTGERVNPEVRVKVCSEARRSRESLMERAAEARPAGDAALKAFLACRQPAEAEGA